MSLVNKKYMSKDFIKAVGIRFIRAFVSGVATSVILITAANIHTWSDLHIALNALALSGIVGGINGVIMGLDKAYRFTE